MPVNYDDRVLQEFTRLPWRWDEHNIPNRLVMNTVGGYFLAGFTGNITINCEGGLATRITASEIIKSDEIKEKFLDQVEKSR